MKNLLRWSELYNNRLDWAERARKDFISSLDKDLQANFQSDGGEVTVVLFGKTQVGKTTLILKLLGINEKSILNVGKILRGGVESGKPSTPTTILYKESASDKWVLSKNGNLFPPMDDCEITERLRELRDDVEKGIASHSGPVVLSIPTKYFDSEFKNYLKIRILDLPGINPVNPEEATHVRMIAEKYVPLADLILLVGRADDLAFIKPGVLDLPQMKDWSIVPRRFRIITTYSTYSDSFRNWLKKESELSKELMRNKLATQIATHGIVIKDSKLLYPLDYGDSWENLERESPNEFQKIKYLVNEFFTDLVKDIKKSATAHNRIMQVTQLQTHIKLRIESAEIKYNSDKEKAVEECLKISYKLDKCNILRNAVATEIKAMEMLCLDAKIVDAQIVSSLECNEIIESDFELSVKIKNKLAVKEYLSYCKNLLMEFCEKVFANIIDVNNLNLNLEIYRKKINKHINDWFFVLLANLEGQCRIFTFDYEYDDFATEAKKIVKSKEIILSSFIRSIAADYVMTYNQYMSVRIENKKKYVRWANRGIKRATDQLLAQDNIKLQIEKRQKDFLERSKDSHELSKKFFNILDSHFLNEINMRVKNTRSSSASFRLIDLCSIVQLFEERKKLLSNGEEC